jgi:hypothetical protein
MFSPVLKLEDVPKPLSDRWPLHPIQIPVGQAGNALPTGLPQRLESIPALRPKMVQRQNKWSEFENRR